MPESPRQIFERVRAAVGPCSADVDPDEHAKAVVRTVLRSQGRSIPEWLEQNPPWGWSIMPKMRRPQTRSSREDPPPERVIDDGWVEGYDVRESVSASDLLAKEHSDAWVKRQLRRAG